ncbi:glycosyltransferase family 9 protein [Micromonospora sp. NBC_01796]|uniref:glycosyltransferase family 9 protein n=1 Tax=Micromonospora sp. NBC_01796 TaxID=2975987 RepID=UPI002DDB87EA|nr:glycosyltransferase family 9 protein [Micromonospora sp. NBC_01796]WSA86240.1 glycosyltransferase family 9 protein [Micromonospora sp. NBC_01796]
MILVLRALGVGDLATAVPALRGLRAAFPDRTLALAAPAWLAPLVDLVGGVDRLVPTDGLDGVDWPGPAPHWAVNLHGRGPRSHRVLQAAGPERLCAFHNPEAHHTDGPPWSADEHEVDRWCRLLDWYDIPADPTDLALSRPSPHRVPVGVTVVHPGAKIAAKRWSPGRFAAVAAELTRAGHRVVVTGSAAERDLAEQVAHRAGLPGPAVLAGRLDLSGLAAVVAHSRLVVSADTGVAHLATAYGIPSVVLFGPVRPEHWGPPADRPWHRALWAAAMADADDPGLPGLDPEVPDQVPVDGDSERSTTHPTLAAIGIEQVLAAVDEVDRVGRTRYAVAT